MDTYGFSNFRVVSRDFTYSCSNLDPQLNDHFYSAVSLEAKQRFAESQTFTGQITIDDNRYILSLTGQTGPYGVLRIAALETTDALDQRVRLVRLRMLVEKISLITLFSIGFLFLVFFLMKMRARSNSLNTERKLRNQSKSYRKNLWQNFNFKTDLI
jgi:hypothetical protein